MILLHIKVGSICLPLPVDVVNMLYGNIYNPHEPEYNPHELQYNPHELEGLKTVEVAVALRRKLFTAHAARYVCFVYRKFLQS